MVKHSAIGLAMILALGACASLPGNNAKQSAAEKPEDRLEARDLNPGECGIFVWTKDAARRFILFSQIENPAASWWSGDGESLISRTSSDGYSVYDQPPRQSFNLPDGGSLDLKLEQPEEITNGTRYKSGSIQIKSADGWDKVMPVIGLAGCQTAQN